ncbi:MAG: AmmeMemoRadiSam system radical SAM enzyme [Planctomycetales bacterium]|nr:AmmeMemoRadiSam system radical SAM enzyme [Planctomycetales bacterium]
MQSYIESQKQRSHDRAMQAAWWYPHQNQDRIVCQLCPRLCSLKPGDRGFCFVRENRDGQMYLSTYGKSTGFCIDPIEKKPLNHFYPGTSVLSFGTAGCNLGCQFCQNWDISKSRQTERLSSVAEPNTIAHAAVELGCKSVAFTYNDPIIWAEYAIDTARACRQAGVKTVAVTAGYISSEARPEFFEFMDAANVDLKAFSEEFYQKITYSHLQPVLDTLCYLKHETDIWFEITNLIIPELNDNPDELRRMCGWILKSIGSDTPIHFSAFHPDFRMMDRPRTDPATLQQAFELARHEGLQYVYVGNVHDVQRQSSFCHSCGQLIVERNWYQLGKYNVDDCGCCRNCQTQIPGRFDGPAGKWNAQRVPVKIELYAPSDRNAQLLNPTDSKDDQVTDQNSQTATPVQPVRRVPAKPLQIDQLKDSHRKLILEKAANWVIDATLGRPLSSPPFPLGDLTDSLVMGVFVTLKRGDVLRGCRGVLGKPLPLAAAIQNAAAMTAKDDQRMAPISPSELPFLSIDVTLLGPFQKIESSGTERASSVEVGKHGLMIQRGNKSGLLLPSVAIEHNWNAQRFLEAVCTKAGLPISAWETEEAVVTTFDGVPIAGNISKFLADQPNARPLPLTKDQLSAYAQLAGQNIVAMATGGTPSYVAPHLPDVSVNAIVLSMQWNDGSETGSRQGNALQVSFRPGIALQSSLFQMCQSAAQMFQQQRFNGQLHLGLTLGFDPALHGYGESADITGVDPSTRAIVISDPRHCGLAYDNSRTAEELRSLLRKNLPVHTRDAVVHSIQVMSTMPSVISISGPTPLNTGGMRPAAVAGKFYPAEDAARRAMVEGIFSGLKSGSSNPLAIMVPHAGLKYSGKVAAQVYSQVANLNQRTLIIISPKHTSKGINWAVCPHESWQISQTKSIASDSQLAQQIADCVTEFKLDTAAHEQEHGIEVQLPLLEQIAPSSKVIGIAMHGGGWHDIQQAATEFATFLRSLHPFPLLVISSDMNHYAPDHENRRRDRLALDAMATSDPQQLMSVCRENDISMCGLVPAAFVMETLRQLGHTFRTKEIAVTTSADVSGDKSQVVGYAGLLLEAC